MLLYRPSWLIHGADSGETWEIFLEVWRPEPTTESSWKFHHPPTHAMDSKHPICFLEPVCLNRTSTFSERLQSRKVDPSYARRSAWWYVRSASRPLKTPAGQWEFESPTLENSHVWTQSHGEFPIENWIILRFHVDFQRCIIPLKINAWKMTVPISTTGDFGCPCQFWGV